MPAEERQGAEEQARHLSATGMYTSDARQGGGERLHPGVVLLYMPVALTCLTCCWCFTCSWTSASCRWRLAWGTCRPSRFSFMCLMCRTTVDIVRWMPSQDGGVKGAHGEWLPGALLLRISAGLPEEMHNSGFTKAHVLNTRLQAPRFPAKFRCGL